MTSSLSLRLLITSALSTIIALLATALVLNQLFRNYFEERIHSELDAWVVTLTSQTQLDVDGQLTVGELGDPRFSQPLSGYYWQVTQENGAPVLSASYWAQPLDLEPPAERGKLAFATIVGSDGEVYLTGSWRITLEHEGEARELLVAVAIDQTSVEAPISSFRRSVTMALALLGTFLVLASWFTVRIGLKPLDKVKAEVNLVKTKPGQRLSTDCAAEVAPLVKEVNDLLESQEQAVETARARASTLAHGLKTPLTVMRALAQDLRSGGDVSTIPDEIDYQVTSTQHLVERELARTRDQMSGQVVQCKTGPVLRKLVQAFQRRVGGDDVAWTMDIAPHAVCPFDEFALTELLGNLIDNATKWTGDKIAISAGGTAIRGFIQVSDNGPGISEAELESVMRRGKRLDETVPGHGLGLSIVQDMVAQRDVDLILSNLPDGGLNARLEWGS